MDLKINNTELLGRITIEAHKALSKAEAIENLLVSKCIITESEIENEYNRVFHEDVTSKFANILGVTEEEFKELIKDIE